MGFLLQCPTKPDKQPLVWENPDSGEALELRGFLSNALEFSLKIEASCDSNRNEAAVESMAHRSPLHESNSPYAGLLDLQGPWGLEQILGSWYFVF